MHADLSDASVHVPAEVLTPPGRREGAPDAHRPVLRAVRNGTQAMSPSDELQEPLDSASGPTYDEIADRALELCIRRGGTNGRELQDWIDAEHQVRTERYRR
jgi:Protein of unknown function (DUF2934)